MTDDEPALGHVEPQKTKPARCSICNRFLRKDGTCVKVFYDDYAGAWEHG